MKLTHLAALIALGAARAQAAEPPVQIRVTLEQMGGQSGMTVEMRFEGSDTGQTVLMLPNEWGGEKELYRGIRNMTVENATMSESEDGPARRMLKHAPNASITLRYGIADDANGPPDKGGGNDYRVRLKPDYIFALGNAWVVEPSSVASEAPAQVTVDKKPKTLVFASDIEHQSMGRPLAFGDVVESALIAGNIRLIDAGGGMRLAIHGKIEARDDLGWRDAFVRIATAQRDYWKSGDEPFLVTIMTEPPKAEGFTSIGGTGRSDAFAFFTTTNAGPERIDQILAHEMTHTWVPRRIGAMPGGQDEPLAYWMSEGFTDWASTRVLARSRYWTPQRFADALNEWLFQYDLSPVRAEPNVRIAKDFWNDRKVGDLPYRRGMLMGLYWDAEIRKTTQYTRDFDDVLWRMQDLAKQDPKRPIRDALTIAMKDVAGLDIAKTLKQNVDNGVPVDLPKDLFGLCGGLEWIERAKFHRGFDIEATQKNGNIIAGVVKGGPAERAGLRDGMKLVKRSGGEIGNSQVEIAYDVVDGDLPRTLRWMPEGQGRERFRKLVLTPDLKGERETACLQRLGGL